MQVKSETKALKWRHSYIYCMSFWEVVEKRFNSFMIDDDMEHFQEILPFLSRNYPHIHISYRPHTVFFFYSHSQHALEAINHPILCVFFLSSPDQWKHVNVWGYCTLPINLLQEHIINTWPVWPIWTPQQLVASAARWLRGSFLRCPLQILAFKAAGLWKLQVVWNSPEFDQVETTRQLF